MNTAEDLARLWEPEGHPLVFADVPYLLFDPEARALVLDAVALLEPETAESFLEALAQVRPLADLGLRALARRTDARRDVLERLLANFWRLSPENNLPEAGLRSLRTAVHPELAQWATDWAFALLQEKWGSVVEYWPWMVQSKITNIIGLLGNRSAIAPLTALWDSLAGDGTVAMDCAIAKALGLIGGQAAVDALVARWNRREGRESEELRKEIVGALAATGQSGALVALLKVAKPSHVAAGRNFQLAALCGLEPVEVLLEYLTQIPSEGAGGLHNAIETALENYFSQEPGDVLLARWDAATGQGVGSVQSAIAKALRRRGEDVGMDALLERLGRFQDETHWYVQQELADLLRKRFVQEPAPVLLERWDRAEGYTAWRVQIALADALKELGDRTVVPALLSRWEQCDGEKAHEVQRAIAQAVEVLGDSTHLDTLLKYWDAAGEEDATYVQEALASAIGELGNPRGIEALLERWDSTQDERELSRSVLRALGKLGGNRVIALLFEKWDYFAALSHDIDTDILLLTIARVLGQIGNADTVEGLLMRWEFVEGRRLYPNAGIRGALEELFAKESPEHLYERWSQATGTMAEEVRGVIAEVLETKFRAEPSVASLMSQWNGVEGRQADMVRRALLRALGVHANTEAVDALLERWDTLDNDKGDYPRWLLLESLKQLGLIALPRLWETWRSPTQPDAKRAAMEPILFTLAARA